MKLLKLTCEGRINRGRVFRTTKDSFVEGLMLLIDDVDPRGNLNEWIEYLLDRSRWTRIMKKRIRVERSDFHF